MSHGNAPDVDCERQHPVLTVADVDAAIAFYTEKLGFKPGFTWGDPTTFAGVNLGSVQVFLKRGTPNPADIEVYFVVDDADALHEFQSANGVAVLVPPGDRDYGIRDYRVRKHGIDYDSHGSYRFKER
jgi:catechol 2,3-dioxygenase-like lactoylglutathione lyase family enzyme